MPRVIGYIDERTIQLLSLRTNPSQIWIGETNVRHMREQHPADFARFYADISRILAKPDFVAQHPRLNSVEFLKSMVGAVEPILVAVRQTSGGTYYVRTLYEMGAGQLDDYLRAGTAKRWE